MKITVDAESLASGVQFATKSFDTKNERAFVGLVVNDGVGYLFHENATSMMKAPIDISNFTFGKGEDGEVRLALDGVYLKRLAQVLSGVKGEVTLSKDLKKATDPLKVQSPTGRFTVPVFDSKVPDLKEVDSLGDVDSYDYFDSLSRLSEICDVKHGGVVPLVSSITLTFDEVGKKITMMSTDRYALGDTIISFTPEDKEKWIEENRENEPNGYSSIFIPVEFAKIIPVSKGAGSVNLVREPKSKKFGYAFDNGRVSLFSLKDVKQALYYEPKKKNAIESITTSVRVPVRSLKAALKNIAVLAQNENSVYLNIDDEGNVSITDDHEQNVISLPVEEVVDPQVLRIAFIREVISHALAVISSDEVIIGITSKEAPVSFRNVGEDKKPLEDAFALAIPSVQRG